MGPALYGEEVSRSGLHFLCRAKLAKEETFGKPCDEGGVGVAGVAVQIQLTGRFGPNLEALLRRLASCNMATRSAAGNDVGGPLQEWRKMLSVALARFTAATILSATGNKTLRCGWQNAAVCIHADRHRRRHCLCISFASGTSRVFTRLRVAESRVCLAEPCSNECRVDGPPCRDDEDATGRVQTWQARRCMLSSTRPGSSEQKHVAISTGSTKVNTDKMDRNDTTRGPARYVGKTSSVAVNN